MFFNENLIGAGHVSGRIQAICIAVAICVVSNLPNQAQAQSRPHERDKIFRQQTNFLDKRATSQYAYSSRLMPKGAWDGQLSLSAPRGGNAEMRRTYMPLAMAAARRHGVPENLFARLVQQESAWNPRARSHKGAIGLAQLMPGTAKSLGVNPNNPAENLDGGAKYLRRQYERFGSWRLALAAYNAGPAAVARHGGVPPYKETQGYVKSILAGLG